jgi:hypothetical protein
LDTTNYRCRITFLTPVLGTQPATKELADYLAKKYGFKQPGEDADRDIPELLEERTTVFPRDKSGNYLVLDHQIAGFLRESASVQNGRVAGKVKNLRSKVENTVFPGPSQMVLNLPKGAEVDYLERPLRTGTFPARVTIARSEMLPEGTWFDCYLQVVPGDIDEAVLRDILDYGYFKGLLQWRNGFKGRFRYDLTKEE